MDCHFHHSQSLHISKLDLLLHLLVEDMYSKKALEAKQSFQFVLRRGRSQPCCSTNRQILFQSLLLSPRLSNPFEYDAIFKGTKAFSFFSHCCFYNTFTNSSYLSEAFDSFHKVTQLFNNFICVDCFIKRAGRRRPTSLRRSRDCSPSYRPKCSTWLRRSDSAGCRPPAAHPCSHARND